MNRVNSEKLRNPNLLIFRLVEKKLLNTFQKEEKLKRDIEGMQCGGGKGGLAVCYPIWSRKMLISESHVKIVIHLDLWDEQSGLFYCVVIQTLVFK